MAVELPAKLSFHGVKPQGLGFTGMRSKAGDLGLRKMKVTTHVILKGTM